jgi:hypothetical protein
MLSVWHDPMKMFFEHKTRMEVDHKIKYVRIVFSSCSCDFLWSIFCHEFSMFGHAHIFSSFILVCIHLKCYITNDVHFIMCALCEKKWLKKWVDQKKKMHYFFQCSSKVFFWYFVWKKIILICVLIICFSLMHITSLLYNTSHFISTHVYMYKHVLSVINNLTNKFT